MKQFILWTLLLLSTAACTVYKDYPIEIYKPGEIAYSPEAKNVAIVYRNFKYSSDSLLHYYKDDFRLKKAKKDPENLDSILVSRCMNELAKNLKEKSNFEEIRIFPELFKPHTGDKLPALNMEMVEELATRTNTDLVISLETYSSFYSEYSSTAEMPTKSNEVITAAVWAVYNPVEKRLIERKTMIDTIFWNGYDAEGNYRRNAKLPPRITALKIASQMVGENYSKRFFASWQNVNRMYSVPPLPDFAAADELVQKGDWDQAIMLWKRYADDSNGKMAINARYNLALGYEMKDDFVTAEKWLNAAQQIATDYRSKDDLIMIIKYRQLLAKRKKDIVRLNQ
ncbi:DUF6340 family protein [uncultured Draconibacterium sp.]|uniref:DUF6340 family protein n=1 Tax=uncultured Draconibacterium sp. TaxID=1573823 RepID=UPI0029C093CC|nr:DUF6340 family protein [uncultured Draconibacterium sp.]